MLCILYRSVFRLAVICSLLVACMATVVGAAAPRRLSCPECGGSIVRKIQQIKTNEVVGTCEEDPSVKHYKAYRYAINMCSSCEHVENEQLLATGLYCECDCGDCGGWCWD